MLAEKNENTLKNEKKQQSTENQNNSKYSRICLICHLKGIRKKWRIKRTDELCKQAKTLSQKLVYSKIQVYDVMVECNN